MATITFIRPYLFAWSAYKINISINNVKLLQLHSGGEQTIALNEGNYSIQVSGFSFRSVTQNISLKEGEDRNIYIYLDFLSRGKFHEKTEGRFLLRAPLGISETLLSYSKADNWESLPVFQTPSWATFIVLIGLIPAIAEITTTHNLLNLFWLLSLILLPISLTITIPNYLKSRRFFYLEIQTSIFLLLINFFFYENIQQPTLIASLSCVAALVIVFMVKYIINKYNVVRGLEK